ncbi:MAG: Ig-like domain-containing protein [Candidatus Gracilibacteria bacterium]|nr:Ig-like domain-containing protein [Candidatus Gracilibacteria bacterium]
MLRDSPQLLISYQGLFQIHVKHEKSKSQKAPHPLRNSLHRGLYWGILVLILVIGSVWRGGGNEWLSSPVVLSPQSSEELIEISPKSSFVIEFDQRMKKETVSNAVSLEPARSYSEQWAGNRLYVIPREPLQKGQFYQVLVDASAENFFGYALEQSYKFSYSVGSEARVLAVHPLEDIEVSDTLTIFFSHAMIPDHAIGSPDLQGLFTLSPYIAGDWSWKNTKTLSFTPRDGFPFSSEFRLYNDAPLKTLNNSLIDDTVEKVYKTASIELLQETPLESSTLVSVDQPFTLHFNQSVSVKSLQDSLRVSRGDGSAVSEISVVKIDEENGVYTVLPNSMQWSYNQNYRIDLKPGLLPERGNTPLDGEWSWQFSTESFYAVNPQFEFDQDVYLADDTFIISFKESVAYEKAKEVMGTLSGIPFTLVEIDKESFKVSLSQNSQKRENIDFVLSKKINPSGKTYLDQDLIIRISKSPTLEVITRETNQNVCFHLSQQLTLESSSAKWKSEAESVSNKLTKSDKQSCEEVEGFQFQYELSKSIIPPESKQTLDVFLADIFGNTKELSLEITRPALAKEDLELFNNQEQFFKTVATPKELVFSYSHKNITDLSVKVCQLSFSQFFSVEYNQSERWSGFFPTPTTCLRIKTLNKKSEVSWDETISSEVDILSVIPEVQDGIFYVQVSSPFARGQFGFSEKAHGIIQYSPLEVISKRGQNSLVWVLDKQSLIPVEQAQVTYYNSDGVAVFTDNTNENGLLVDTKVKLKYDYLTAMKGNKEVLLYAFDQTGLEPWRYGAPFNFDENEFLFQVVFESNTDLSTSRDGLVVLKQREQRSAKSPRVSSVVLTLENLTGDMLWRKISPVDEFGNIPFTVEKIVPLGKEKLIFGICIGLHDSICQGTFLSTELDFKTHEQHHAKDLNNSVKEKHITHKVITIEKSPLADVGDTVSLQLKNLKSGFPVLITAESDHIAHAEVFVAASQQEEVIVELKEDMIPEVFFSVTQFTDTGLLYDLDGIWIGHQSKTIDLTQLNSADSFEEVAFQTLRGKSIASSSIVVFKKYDRTPFAFPNFLEKFYPQMGNSVLTASTQLITTLDKQEDHISMRPLQQQSHLLIFPGDIELLEIKDSSPSEVGRTPSDLYYFVHDREGHFGMNSQQRTIPLKAELVLEDFSIQVEPLPFMRPSDRAVIDIRISNKTDFSRNLLFDMESTGVSIQPSQSVFVGISGNDTRTLPVTLELPPQKHTKGFPGVLFDLKGDTRTLAQKTLVIQHAEAFRYLPNRHHIWNQFEAGQGNLLVPSTQTEGPMRLYTIATSPIAYVIGNLSEYMKRDTLWNEEIIQRAALIALFQDLVPEKNDHLQELIDLLKDQEPIENVLEYLQYSQREDGGWSELPSGFESDLSFSIANAKRLSDIEQHISTRLDQQMRNGIVTYLKLRLQEKGAQRITDEIDLRSLSDEDSLAELRHLSALSALSPSGIPFANNWYGIRDQLSDHALVTLLIIFEDYRDAKVSGSNYKIEEITQLLKERQKKFRNTIWIKTADSSSDFIATSLYLQSLVRQASSHLDIPEVISWLNDNKYKLRYQSRDNQYTFLKAMASYLRLYQESQIADKISLQFGDGSKTDFQLNKEVKGQFFQISNQFQYTSDQDELLSDISAELSAVPRQALFSEVSWEIQDNVPDAQGISVFSNTTQQGTLQKGDIISGEIHILSPFPRKKVIIIQHLPSLIHVTGSTNSQMGHQKQVGDDQIWTMIDQLPPGQTTIPFEWTAQLRGTATIPPIEVFSAVEPDVYATSQEKELRVR